MPRSIVFLQSLLSVLLVLVSSAAAALPEGTFAGDGMRLELTIDGAGCAGTMELNGTSYPVQLTGSEQRLEGHFTSDGHGFQLVITRQGDSLVLESGGGQYVLAPVGAAPVPVNPLGGSETPAAPSAPASSAGGSLAAIGQPRLSSTREWTMLLYLDGDNNLEAAALGDLDELESVAGNPAVEVLVLIDRADGYTTEDGDWTGARLYRVTPDTQRGRIASELIVDLGEVDMSDPALLAEAIATVFPTWPSRHRALVLWDHGGGWSTHSHDESTAAAGGVGHMSMPQARQAIAAGIEQAGIERIELIGFDMCLMGELETAVELVGLTDVVVFSQAIEPGNGWPYDAIMPRFAAGTMGARRLGQEIVQAYGAFYDAQGVPGTTQSAVDTRRVGAVLEATEAIVEKLEPSVAAHWPTMARTIFFSRGYGTPNEESLGTEAVASFDLMDIMQRLRLAMGEDWPAEEEYRALVRAMDDFIIANRVTGKDPGSHGIAVYAPIRPAMLDPVYGDTVMGGSNWMRWLQAIHAAQDQNDPKPVIDNFRLQNIEGDTVQALEAFAGHGIHFNLQGTNILQGELWEVEETEDGLTVWSISPFQPTQWLKGQQGRSAEDLELLTLEFEDGDNEIRIPLIGMHLKILLGDTAYRATIDSSDRLVPGSISVPCLYEHPSVGQQLCRIYFDADTWMPVAMFAFSTASDGSMLMTGIEPESSGRVVLLAVSIDQQTGDQSFIRTGEGTWENGPELIPDLNDAGDMGVMISVETIGGATSRNLHTVQIERPPQVDQFAAETQRLFTPANLEGDWKMVEAPALIKDGRIVEIPFTMQLRSTPDSPMMQMRMAGQNDQTGASVEIIGRFFVENRLVPMAEWWEVDAEGNHGTLNLQLPYFRTAPDGRPVLCLKNPNSEFIYTWIKTGGTELQTGSGEPPAAGSGQGAAPAAAANLQGVWITAAEDAALQIEGSQYAMLYPDGFGGWEVDDTGRFQVQGDVLAIESADGSIVQMQFQVDAMNLVLSDGYEQLVFQRAE
jgi:hypothetical protein